MCVYSDPVLAMNSGSIKWIYALVVEKYTNNNNNGNNKDDNIIL